MPDLNRQIVVDTSPLLALCAACGDFAVLQQVYETVDDFVRGGILIHFFFMNRDLGKQFSNGLPQIKYLNFGRKRITGREENTH
jgi:hypothetical protein